MPIADIRWRDVYARIKPAHKSFTAKGPGILEGYRVEVVVRWEGQLFTSKMTIPVSDFDLRYEVMEKCVEGIDRLMEEHGYLPYEIRSK